jgi:hypothetical protein
MPIVRVQVRTLAVPAAVAAVVAVILAAGSCTSTPTPILSGDFLAPTGLAVTAAGDRDLLFIASAGGDELRALNICTTPTLPDGGQDPANTCPTREDFRFVPGPIRLFPASLAVGDRPVRLAGARLTAPDGGSIGAVLVGGADNVLKVIDAANVVDAQNGTAKLKAPAAIDLISAPPADVIAVNAYSQTAPDIEVGSPAVRAYALTETAQGTPAHLVALRITAGPTGPQVAKVGRCALPADLDASGTTTNVVGTRLAIIPRSGIVSPDGGLAVDAPFDTLLYVADGPPNGVVGKLGDGALEFDTTAAKQPALNTGSDPLDAPGATLASVPPCTPNRRISATTAVANPDGGAALTQPQALRSIALSPRFFAVDAADAGVADGGAADAGPPPPVRRDYAPGALMLGATVDGKIAFVRTDLGGLAPLPPLVLQPGVAASPMEDLRVNGFAREVNFLKPPSRCLGGCDPTLPPTLVQVGNPSTALRSMQLGLVGVTTSSDGYTYFLDGDKRRLLSDVRDALGTSPFPYFDFVVGNLGYLYIPSQVTLQTAPTLTFPPPETANGAQIPGGACCVATLGNAVNGGNLTAGVTLSARWRLVFHGPIPGLERRGGTLTRGASGKLHIEFPKGNASASFDNWTRSNPQLLDTGDVFVAWAYSKPDGSAPCDQLAAESHPVDPALAREFAITALTPFSLDATEPANFRIDNSCLPAGITVEIRSAGGLNNAAWMVFEGAQVRGRARNGTLFVAPGLRADYPLDYATGTSPSQYFPTPDKDISVAFTITGPEPAIPQSLFTFSIKSGQIPTRVNDAVVAGAFAGPAIVYTSPKVTNLVFTSVTGANSVIQIDPAAIQVLNGVLVYR